MLREYPRVSFPCIACSQMSTQYIRNHGSKAESNTITLFNPTTKKYHVPLQPFSPTELYFGCSYLQGNVFYVTHTSPASQYLEYVKKLRKWLGNMILIHMEHSGASLESYLNFDKSTAPRTKLSRLIRL